MCPVSENVEILSFAKTSTIIAREKVALNIKGYTNVQSNLALGKGTKGRINPVISSLTDICCAFCLEKL